MKFFTSFGMVLLSLVAINTSRASFSNKDDFIDSLKSLHSDDEIKLYYKSNFNLIEEEYNATYKSAQENKREMQKSGCIDHSGNFLNPNSLLKSIFFKDKCDDMFYILLEQNSRLAQLKIYKDHFEKLSLEYDKNDNNEYIKSLINGK